MKKIIPIILALTLLLGCSNPPKDSSLEEVTYEGCQYIYTTAYPPGTYTITHKGNCTNCWTKMEQLHK